MSNYSLNEAQARGQQGYAVFFVLLVVAGIIFAAFHAYKPEPTAKDDTCAATLASLGSEAPTGREYRALQQICRSVR